MRGNNGLSEERQIWSHVSEGTTVRGRTSKAIQTFGIEDNQGNIVTDHQLALRIREICIQDLYDSENHPKDIVIKSEEELDEDDKGPAILKSEIVKAIKDMRRKKATGDENIHWIYSWNWEIVDWK